MDVSHAPFWALRAYDSKISAALFLEETHWPLLTNAQPAELDAAVHVFVNRQKG